MLFKNQVLANILKSKNITQSELARLTGITQSSISDWINGKYEPKINKIQLIADTLHIPITEIYDFDKKYNSEEIASDAKLYESLNARFNDFDSSYLEVLKLYDCLNDTGKKKAFEDLEDISNLDKYSK